ncbi:MAG: SBBP repeat-containing protein [Thermoguttaceae bacterium]|nr:SBBP repeat-containing protein [Thermoguttaceae bacterium]
MIDDTYNYVNAYKDAFYDSIHTLSGLNTADIDANYKALMATIDPLTEIIGNSVYSLPATTLLPAWLGAIGDPYTALTTANESVYRFWYLGTELSSLVDLAQVRASSWIQRDAFLESLNTAVSTFEQLRTNWRGAMTDGALHASEWDTLAGRVSDARNAVMTLNSDMTALAREMVRLANNDTTKEDLLLYLAPLGTYSVSTDGNSAIAVGTTVPVAVRDFLGEVSEHMPYHLHSEPEPPPEPQPGDVNLLATRSAYVTSSFPNSRFDGSLPAGFDGYDYESYLDFTLSQIPLGSTITSATLYLNVADVSGAPLIGAMGLTESWSSSTVSYNERPEGSQVGLGSFITALGWVGFDVKEYVQPCVNLQAENFGFGLYGHSGTAIFHSRSSANAPYLAINYTTPSGRPDLLSKDVNVGGQTSVTVAPGDQISVRYDIRNQGAVPAASSAAAVVWSTNTTFTLNDELLATKSTPALAVGSSDRTSRTVTVPSDAQIGKVYYIGVIADYQDVIDESNEANNPGSNYIAVTIRDSVSPIGSLSISSAHEWDGDEDTLDSPFVRIHPYATDNSGTVHSMRVSFDGVNWQQWQPYSPASTACAIPQDVLDNPAEPITVYIQYRDAAGNESTVYSDSLSITSAPLVVTTASDIVGNDGALSLREALLAAALRPGETITFDPSLYASGPITIVLAGAPLEIMNDLAIEGPGAEHLILDGDDRSRVMSVGAGVTATISGLTITGGAAGDAGGLFNFGELTVTNCAIVGNRAHYGAGPPWGDGHGGGIFNAGILLLSDSIISNNTASAGGGGLVNWYEGGSGTSAIIQRTTISDNTTDYAGGGILNWGREGYVAELDVTVIDSTISGNSAADGGGGIYSRFATMTIANVTVSANSAYSASAVYNVGDAVIEASAITGNTSTGKWGSGAIDNTGNLSVVNSFIAYNTAYYWGGGIYVDPDASVFGPVSTSIVNSAIIGNRAVRGGGVSLGLSGTATATIANSIIANNHASTHPDADFFGGALEAGSGHNLYGIWSEEMLLDPNSIYGTPNNPLDPMLTVISNEQGTATHYRPMPDSPVVDSGNNTLARDSSGNPLMHDILNNTRMVDYSQASEAIVDIGAVELQPAPPQLSVTSTRGFGIMEGETVSVGVALTGAPAAPVSVSIAKLSVGSDKIEADKALMQFDGSNWDIPQWLTIVAPRDDDTDWWNVYTDMLALSAPGMDTVHLSVDVRDDPSPSLAWSTYIGGSNADGNMRSVWGGFPHDGFGIAVDTDGNAFVTSMTESTDFAGATNTLHGGFDAFLAKVSPEGDTLWATYLGGTDGDEAMSVAIDADGNVLVTGMTFSEDFTAATNDYYGGWNDAFVAKVSPEGELLWATYLGGSENDQGLDIAIDSEGDILVTGWTNSPDFAGAINSPYGVGRDGWIRSWGDAFIAKLSSEGELLWTTYVGGSDDEGGLALVVDKSGNAYITGGTASQNLPEAKNTFTGGAYDAFLAKVSTDGALLWTTYFGGSDEEAGFGIALDQSGNILVTGGTLSTDLAGANNAYYGGDIDGFVAKFSPSGNLLWSTYVGGNGSEGGFDLAVDSDGNAWITGGTDSTEFAESENQYRGGEYDAFLAHVTADGTVVWATYVGGSDAEGAFSIVLDGAGNVLIAGGSYSPNLEKANNEYKAAPGSYLADTFIAKILLPSATTPPTYDVIGRVGGPGGNGDWWLGESNGTDAFSNSKVNRWNPNLDWADIMVGDFTGNGLDDIAGRIVTSGDWWLAVNNGDGTFTNQKWGRWNPNVTFSDIMVGDFTGDEVADIVGRVATTGDWWVARSTGSSFTNQKWGRWNPNVEFTSIMAADFTGDGKADIAGRIATTGDWWVARSTGSSFTNQKWGRWNPNIEFTSIMAADFTGDVKADIAGRIATTGDWWVAKSTGTGFTNAKWTRWNPSLELVDVMTADFTGDGKADIAGRVATTGDWWVGASTGTGFANAKWTRWNPSLVLGDVMTADFTGDGVADIAGRVATSGDWWVAESTGTGFTNAKWTRWNPTLAWGQVLVGNFAPAPAALHAAYAPTPISQFSPDSQLPTPISQSALQPIVEEAVLRMSVDLEQVAFQVHIVDLPGLMLGRTVGTTIQIDHNAAGFGWYLSPTNADFEPGGRLGELTARPGTGAVHRIDLLTAVMHELGHLLGYDHTDSGLMQPALGPGVRWLPDTDAASALVGSDALLDDQSVEPDRLDAYFATLG